MTEIQDSREQRREERKKRREERRQRWANGAQGQFGIINGRHNNVLTGAFILLIGIVALMRATIPDFPAWVFDWHTGLIAFGLFIGIRHNFRGGAWLILLIVGGIFLFRDIFPGFSFNRIWPVVLIVVGAFIILRPRRRWKWDATKRTEGQVIRFLVRMLIIQKMILLTALPFLAEQKRLSSQRILKGVIL
jgi:hypothetical protein